MAQTCLPLAVIRQQVTNPRFPQIDLTAHRLIAPLQDFGSMPVPAAALATAAAHLT